MSDTMYALQIIFCIVVIYIIFAVAPAAVSLLMTFSAKKAEQFSKLQPGPQCMERYGKEAKDAYSFLKSLHGEEVVIKADDGISLSGVFYDGGFEKTVIFIHGFSATPMSHVALQAQVFYQKGYNVLLIYQRAHGKSGGSFTTMGLKEQYDLLSWIEWARKKTDKILLYGVSMGATTVEYCSDKLDKSVVRGMILDCGFVSVNEQMISEGKKRNVPLCIMMPNIRIIGRILFHVNFKETVTNALKKTDIPALFLHGRCDKTVPVSDTEKNYDSCASSKEKIIVENAGHTEAFWEGGEAVRQRVTAWADKVMSVNA